MDTLNPSSVELVSSPRPAPLNGAPRSHDYNQTQNEILADLAELSGFINEVLLPILQALPETAEDGLDGASMFADRTLDTPLFRDSSGVPRTVSEVLRAESEARSALTQQMADLAARVLALQTRLSTTQQQDLRASVQSLQDSYTGLATRLTKALADISSNTSSLSKFRRVAETVPEQLEGENVLNVLFYPPFANNNYVASLALEAEPGVSIAGFSKKPDGVGLTVRLLADASSPTGILHVMAQAL